MSCQPAKSKCRISPKTYVYSWIIENFSFFLEKTGSSIRSPPFTIQEYQDTTWYLIFYPNGKSNSDFMSSRLFRAKREYDVENVCVSVERTISMADNTICSFKRELNVNFEPDSEGELVAIERKKITSDTVVINCRMWVGEICPFETIVLSAVSRVCVESYWFDWKLENLNGEWSVKPIEKTLESSTSTSPNLLASLSQEEERNTTKLNFDMIPGNAITAYIYRSKIYLTDDTGALHLIATKEIKKETLTTDCNFSLEVNWNDLVGKKYYHLPMDAFNLKGQLQSSKGLITTHKINHPQNECEKASYPQNMLSTSLLSFWKEGILTDVKLKTTTKEFSAHRVVLSSFSDVFKSMFTADMVEKISDGIDMSDMQDDVVHQLLTYMYTGQVEGLEWDLTTRLYYAADKYQVQSLREYCKEFLVKNLTTTNFLDALILAEMHQDKMFRVVVEDYISRNRLIVLNSYKWKELEENNPELAIKTQRNIMLNGASQFGV